MDIPIELALENEVLAASLELGMKGDPGKDGITPTIGENGNWYYGSEDSGKPSRGLTGPAGPQGEKGETGPQGPTGPAGQTGEQGAAGTTFTPSVSDSGVLSWTNDGGKENPASVSIKGPQGEPGQTGPTGPQGPQGEAGPQGPQGEQGPTGPAGSYSFDAEPTMDSGNLVKSGGIFAAIPRLIASAGINIESFTGEDGKLSYVPSIDKTWLLDAFHPVGSIYQSVNSTSPATLFGGGTWERIEDKFLLAAGGTYAAGSTGGEASVSLTVEEIPSHNHGNYIEIAANASDKYIGGGSAYGDLYRATAHTGGGQPHNNMPPYQAVYVWQRTA